MYRIIGADGREYGPVSRETLVQWLTERRANAQSWVQAEGDTAWRSLNSLPEFAAVLGGTAPGETMRPPVAAYVPIAPVVMPRRTNGMAVASLIMGLLSVCGCCCCYGMPFNFLGVLFAVIALSQINQAPHLESGRELAVAGLVLSLASLILAVFAGLFGMVASLPQISHEVRRW